MAQKPDEDEFRHQLFTSIVEVRSLSKLDVGGALYGQTDWLSREEQVAWSARIR